MSSGRTIGRFLLPVAMLAAGAAVAYWMVPAESRAVERQLIGFPDSDAFAHLLRPALLGVLCFIPGLTALGYALAGILDRYLFRQFLTIAVLCFSALFMMWFLLDLSNHLNDLRQSDHFLLDSARFYLLRFPGVFVLVAPYSLSLSLLYCLGKLSRSREIVAIIQTGRGMLRVVAPFLTLALSATLVCTVFNYHWAPSGEGSEEMLLVDARGGRKVLASNVLYYYEPARRLWKVGEFPYELDQGAPLRAVEVTSMTPDGNLQSRLKAPYATWDRTSRRWLFDDPEVCSFVPDQPPHFDRPPSPLIQPDWPETPWQLIKPGLPARFLGIPDLNSWLAANRDVEWADKRPYLTQWHYRWAQPVVCLVTVLLAAPLGIVFSRRGATGGVALAIFVCAGMLFVSGISLTLGEAGYLPPALAAWTNNLVFGTFALWLFHRRMVGLPIYQTLRRLLPMADDT
jgi:LPS export ABC transporter permease LptG